jgi:hypothetical protein
VKPPPAPEADALPLRFRLLRLFLNLGGSFARLRLLLLRGSGRTVDVWRRRRLEFYVAGDVRDRYVNCSVGKGGQNPGSDSLTSGWTDHP